jgi:hypothetical protein
VPLLLKLPFQRERVGFSNELNTIGTHHLVLSMLERGITNPAAAASILERAGGVRPGGPLRSGSERVE